MTPVLFVSCFGVILLLFIHLCCSHLPAERWQMLAVIPAEKEPLGWRGINLTYYGLLLATSQVIAITLLLLLLAAIGAKPLAVFLTVVIILGAALPAARLMAILVEKKYHTFTVGGASFVGIIIAPWTVLATGHLTGQPDGHLPLVPTLAAMSIALCLGEGLGRLGCISFGCCYGKPIDQLPPIGQRLLARLCFSFHGETKKAIYEGNMAGWRLIPIQGITAVLYTLATLVGCLLFLYGHFTSALLVTIGVSQLWRYFSETLRADYRGDKKMSDYQKMSLAAVAYLIGFTLLSGPQQAPVADLEAGLLLLWSPGPILLLQVLWLALFIYFGRSSVTSATVSFRLHRDRI